MYFPSGCPVLQLPITRFISIFSVPEPPAYWQTGREAASLRANLDFVKVYKDHKTVQIDSVERIKKPPSPYVGVSPTGTEGGEFIPVSKIQEVMNLTKKIIDSG